MKVFLRLAVVLLIVSALTSLASAKYKPEHDIYINVDAEVLERIAAALALSELGDELFDAQEGAHATTTDTTGQEVDHYYIWFCAGDQCIPVDPFTVSN